jgi:hypothetical protein
MSPHDNNSGGFLRSGQEWFTMAPQSHDFEESAAGTRGIVMADGRRDLVDGLRKLQQFPSAGHSKALNGRLTYGWYPSQ